MSRRGWWSAVIGIALTAGVAVPVGLATPAGAAETTFTETCADVYGHRSMGDLDKTTDPVPGSAVTPGQELAVTLHWPTFAVAGTRAHRLLECLSIDRGAPQTWVDRQFTTSEGTTTLSEVVPTGLAPRTTVCGQSFLKTQGSFGPVTRWSEKTCYPVGGAGSFHAMSRSPSPPSASAPSPPPSPQNRSTPTTRGPYVSPPPSPPSGSGEYQAPWPPWEKAPRVSASARHDDVDDRAEVDHHRAPQGGGHPGRRPGHPQVDRVPGRDAAPHRGRRRGAPRHRRRRPVLRPDAAEGVGPHRRQPAGAGRADRRRRGADADPRPPLVAAEPSGAGRG